MIIFKYPLKVQEVQVLTLPLGTTILSVVEQHENICIYAEVGPSETERGGFYISYSDHWENGPIEAHFLGTVKLSSGALMFHVFYE